jgi:hypothetical protein
MTMSVMIYAHRLLFAFILICCFMAGAVNSVKQQMLDEQILSMTLRELTNLTVAV